MFKHLLVTLDGSELAEKALNVARQVLAAEGTITLLSVVDMPDANLTMLYDMPVIPMRGDQEKLLATAQQNARSYLRRVAERLELPPTVHVEVEVYMGDTAYVIAERARALHVDAIVMSTHGRSGLSRWVFGSITQRVLSLMPCPVLVVPGQSPAHADTSSATEQQSPADAHIAS